MRWTLRGNLGLQGLPWCGACAEEVFLGSATGRPQGFLLPRGRGFRIAKNGLGGCEYRGS